MWWWDVHSSRVFPGKGRILAFLALFVFNAHCATVNAQASRCRFLDINDDLAWFIRHEIGSRVNGNNPAFIQAVSEGRIKAKLFFHIDNAVLKILNDRYFHQELSAAVESLYTRLFFENMNAEAILKADLVYSDYKTIRLGFEHDTEEIRSALKRVYEKTAADFAKGLAEVASLRELYSKGDGLVADPSRWHLGGFGKNPDEASTIARRARWMGDDATGLIPIQDFHDEGNQAFLKDTLANAETLRAKIQKDLRVFRDDLGLLTPSGVDGRMVPSLELVEILRKIPGGFPDTDARYVRGRVGRRFGIILTKKQAERLIEYYRDVDLFSPSIYESQEVMDFGLRQADYGAVRVDLSGQNARNLSMVMKSLARAEAEPENQRLDKALHLARAGQNQESKEFENRRELFRQAIGRLGWKGNPSLKTELAILFSGDDGIFLPARPLTESEKQLLMNTLARLGRAADYRLTFIPGKFPGTDVIMPLRDRAAYISAGETVEKALRKKLEAAGISKERLGRLMIGLDMEPGPNGEATFNVILANEYDAEIVDEINAQLPAIVPPELKLKRIIAPHPKGRVGWRTRVSLRCAAPADEAQRWVSSTAWPSGSIAMALVPQGICSGSPAIFAPNPIAVA